MKEGEKQNTSKPKTKSKGKCSELCGKRLRVCGAGTGSHTPSAQHNKKCCMREEANEKSNKSKHINGSKILIVSSATNVPLIDSAAGRLVGVARCLASNNLLWCTGEGLLRTELKFTLSSHFFEAFKARAKCASRQAVMIVSRRYVKSVRVAENVLY